MMNNQLSQMAATASTRTHTFLESRLRLCSIKPTHGHMLFLSWSCSRALVARITPGVPSRSSLGTCRFGSWLFLGRLATSAPSTKRERRLLATVQQIRKTETIQEITRSNHLPIVTHSEANWPALTLPENEL